MTARTVPLGAPFRWLMKAVDVGRRNPRALFGGFALLTLLVLLPTVLQSLLQAFLPNQLTLMWSLYAIVIVASLVLMPPLMGSGFRLLHACETGQPASAMDIFHGYRDLPFAIRMVLTALLLMLAYAVVLGALFVLMPAKEFMMEAFTRAMSTPPGGEPDMSGLPPFDVDSGMWLVLWMLGGMTAMFALMHVQFLSYGHAALGGHGPLSSVAGAFMAALKNVLPLFCFTVAMLVVGFVLMLVVVLVLGLMLGALLLVSPVLAGVVTVPIYFGVSLLMYVVMFGFYYHGWREIFDEPAADPMDAIAA